MKKIIPLIILAVVATSLNSCKFVSPTDSRIFGRQAKIAEGPWSEERSWIDMHDRKN